MRAVRRNVVIVGVVVAIVLGAVAWKLFGHSSREVASTSHAGSAAPLRIQRAPAAPASLAGRVTKKADGSPLAGATLAISATGFGKIMQEHDEPPTIVTSNAAGAWNVPQLPPGTYTVTATARGFLPATHARFALAAGEQRTGIDLALEPGGTLVHGTISDVGGGPIGGATVYAIVSDPAQIIGGNLSPYAVTSGGDGTYELSLPDGKFELAVHHDDYTEAQRSIEVAGKPRVEDFALVPGGTIRGQVVVRGTNKPVPGARVVAHASGHRFGGASRDATSDGDGKFTIKSLGSGAVSVAATAPGFASGSPSVVELGIGEQVDGVRVLVEHAPSIFGTVVEKSDKKPLPGVRVLAWSMGSQAQAMAPEPSDKDGTFEIPGLKPGSYILFAIGEDKMPEMGKTVEVADKDVTGVTIEMATGATLSGRVDPPHVATIALSLTGDIGLGNLFEVIKTAFVHADSDANGRFEIKHVPAGSFSLVATTREGPGGKLPIVVTAADQRDLVISLEQRASISGRVIDTKGNPAAGVHVRAQATEKKMTIDFSMMNEGTTSGDDGAFKVVGLEPGKYTVHAGDWSEMFDNKDKDKKKAPEVIELAAGAEHTGVTLTVAVRDGVIRGVVTMNGKTVPDAWVTARRTFDSDKMSDFADFGATTPVLTKDDGKFTIDKLRDGTYTVVADGPRGSSRADKKAVKPGDSVTLELAPLGTLSGHVAQKGAPVIAYDLTCHGPAGRVDRHVEAADGSYALEHLAPGHYACDAQADAGTADGEVDVPAGAATLELSLVPWASITGLVVSVLTGQPVANVIAIETSGKSDQKELAAILTGGGPTTDATGRFSIDHVGAGSGSIMLMAKVNLTSPLATKPYTVAQGQRLDLGVIKVVPPRNGDPGTLGMATEPGEQGLNVTLVQAGGPAAQAGVVVGDVITSIDGHSIAELTPDVAQKVLSSGLIGVGDRVVLELARGATVTVTAAKW